MDRKVGHPQELQPVHAQVWHGPAAEGRVVRVAEIGGADDVPALHEPSHAILDDDVRRAVAAPAERDGAGGDGDERGAAEEARPPRCVAPPLAGHLECLYTSYTSSRLELEAMPRQERLVVAGQPID